MPPEPEIGAIILAGGTSRRMGQNKSLLPYRGVPLIQHIARQLQAHFDTVLLNTNEPEAFAFLRLPTVRDRVPDQGPLMGASSSLEAARHDWNLLVATDIPELPLDALPVMIALSAGHRCVVARTADGVLQPLFGLYHRSVAAEMRELLSGGERRMQALMARCRPASVAIEAGALQNLNTPADYAAALESEERRGGSPGAPFAK